MPPLPVPPLAAASSSAITSVPAGWQRLPSGGAPAGAITERWELEPGLSVVRSSVMTTRDVAQPSATPPEQGVLVLTFGLEGQSGFRSTQGDQLGFQAGFTTAAAVMGSRGERRFAAGQRVVQLRLLVQAPLLARLVGDAACAGLLPRQGMRPLGSARTRPGEAGHALALYRHAGHGPSGMAMLEARIHALSLLSGELRALGLAEGDSSSHVPVPDALARARDLMAAQLEQPLTIAYIAASVGLSETRFKAGFKAAFGLSPGRMLLRLRMERASVLLDGGCQVAQAAWQVGYAHPGNFSAAFSRYFGQAPKARRNQGAARRP